MYIRTVLTFTTHAVLSIIAASHALITKRDPRAAAGWIAACLFVPVLGPLFYFIFGINRVKKKARALRRLQLPSGEGERERGDRLRHPASRDIPAPEEYFGFSKISESVTHRPVVGGNNVEMLTGGDKAYDTMLESISAARRTVYLSSYIFLKDTTGKRFIEELAQAAARGVDVRVLLDGIGELYSLYRTAPALRKRGVQVIRFLPPSLIPPNFMINLRNHRKILTVDSETGFAGGMNIGDHNLESAAAGRRVSDLHFRFKGAVVEQLEQIFLEDWCFAAGRGIAPAVPTSPGNPWSPVSCRTVVDGPDENMDKLATVLTSAVSAARSRILIVTPYFLPSREMISALNSASLRGVDVTVILPGKNNLPFVHWATRNLLWELLQRGIRICYQPPPFAHSKLFVVDDRYTVIGSANIDPRSLRLNFEVNIEVFDRSFASIITKYSEEVIKRCREVTLEEVDVRPLPARLRDALAWLFSPYF